MVLLCLSESHSCSNCWKIIMVQLKQLRHSHQHNEFRSFLDKFDLNITTAPEQEQQPHVQWEFLDNHSSRYSELPRRMEKDKDRSADAQQHGEQVPQPNTLDGCVDHLLILAQSAEIIEQSGDGVAGTHTDNQNKGSHSHLVEKVSQEYAGNITADDQDCSRELLDRLPVLSHISSQRCGIYHEDARPRLTQVRKQARCKYLILNKEWGEDKRCKHLQGKTIRLSQIKHQARCKSKNDLPLKKMSTGPRNELPQGRLLRLSQMRHLARSKGNKAVNEGFEEHMDGNLHCKDSNLSMSEDVPTHNVFRAASQSSGVRWNGENLREHQRTARQLRAFKTRKLRQRFRTQCASNSASKRLHALKISPIGLTSTTNSQWLSHSAVLLKAKDSIAGKQELPEPSGCNGKLGRNFGAAELQGNVGCNGSPGFRYKYYQHIPRVLPVQNNVLSFTTLSNNIFQQCDTNMGWMLYMYHMQFMEYHRVVSCQHRADHTEEKRGLKDKQQSSKSPVHENSDAQKEYMAVKRLRLTHLRREVRSGNQWSVVQGPAEK